eukprot:Phypoly_transcript_02795.p1 GENE.Phypoly_transcript_02795~~Phypoly_transcript_02795.p1  ORF type:complete len:436 (-),score=128.45 Phypoly_transcript_02795:1314-2621(-)
MMWQDKENINININQDQLQCFTPKKSLRDIFSSVSNSKISPKKRSPKRSPNHTPQAKRIALRETPVRSAFNPAFDPNKTSLSFPKLATPNFFDAKPIATPNFFDGKPEQEIDDPMNTSLAHYNFSFFHLQPPPSPSPRMALDFSSIGNSESDQNSAGSSEAASSAAPSDTNSVASGEEISEEDRMALDLPVAYRRPSVALALATSSANPFAPPSLPSSHSCSALSSILNSSGPKPQGPKSKPSSAAPKLVPPTRMRVPKAKTSAWAVSAHHKAPPKKPETASERELKPNRDRADELMAETELEMEGIFPRSTSMMSFPTFAPPEYRNAFPISSNYSSSKSLSLSSSETSKSSFLTSPRKTTPMEDAFRFPSSKPLANHPLPEPKKRTKNPFLPSPLLKTAANLPTPRRTLQNSEFPNPRTQNPITDRNKKTDLQS